MITSVIAPQGQQRPGQFSRIEEYVFIAMIGTCEVTHWNDQMIDTSTSTARKERKGPGWDSLLRRGTEPHRVDRPGMFYPIFVKDSELVSIGESLALDEPRDRTAAPEGALVVWPVRTDGSEGRWQVGPERLKKLFSSGYAKVGLLRGRETPAIMYLKSGEIERLEGGDDATGASISPRSVWNRPSHNAGAYGSTFLRSILPGRKFPFPKSLYAVEDALRFFVRKKQMPSFLISFPARERRPML
jgi:adenine-specific DNA-methyltransferase